MKKRSILGSEKLAKYSVLIGVALLAAIGVLDELTGIELRVFPLYFIPVALIANTHSRGSAIAASIASTLVWSLANHEAWRSSVHFINVVSQAVAFLCVSILVNHQKERADRHQQDASTDELTGLLNSRAFYARAERQLQAQMTTGGPLTVAYLDVDNFKHVNTALGHVGADDVLRAVSGAMTRALRASDVFGRIGGDEFALLLPGASRERTAEVLARVRKSVGEATAGHAIPITFSVGAVLFEKPADSVATMMKLSDALMYRVKNGSKDAALILSAVELADAPPSSRRQRDI